MKKKKLLIQIGHPAHIHQFRNLYKELAKKGWEGLFVIKDKECVLNLIEHYRLPYTLLGHNTGRLLGNVLSLPSSLLKTFKVALQFKPDVFISRVSLQAGFASLLQHKPHITFTDTESAVALDKLTIPLTSLVLTSDSYKEMLGKKQLRYPGYHELAYLHPNIYKPNEAVLDTLRVEKNEKYAIVRFVAWAAHHDVGQKGMSSENKLKLVRELSKHLKVFISSEGELEDELKQYQIKIKPEQMHDALNYAHLFVGESGTMASESAVLGTPAIFFNNKRFGCIDDQVRYGLISHYSESEDDQLKAIEKAVEIAKQDNIKEEYAAKRDKMLEEKIDVTAFMVWFVENYPDSEKEMRKEGFSFDRFRGS